MSAPLDRQTVQDFYDSFNRRDIEVVLNAMQPDVQWANGMEGGFVHGQDKVRKYWTAQFEQFQPQLEILSMTSDERDRAIVIVRQTVRNTSGQLLQEQDIGHRYTFRDGLIALFEIIDADPKPETAVAE